jgi:purine-binding chemotaxis protein CheW
VSDAVSLLLVHMGARPCGIPCEHVVEIVPRVNLSQLPDAPAGVLGVINLRGRVVPVMDIRPRVAGAAAGTPPPYQHLVIVEAHGRQIGLAVDEVNDVLDVPRAAVERPGELAGVHLPGVVRVRDDLVLVLGPDDFNPGHAGA